MPLRALAGGAAVLLTLAALPLRLSPEDQAALASLTEARVLSGRLGDRVWPGYELHAQQLLAYDGDRQNLLVGAGHPPARFAAVAGAGIGVYGHAGALPEVERARSPEVSLSGRPTVALPYSFLESDQEPLPWKVFAPAFGVWAHHHFAVALEYDRLANRPYPTANKLNAAASELEDRLLADALRTIDPTETRSLAREFLAVRSDRRRHLTGTISRFEDLAEIMTGIPRYVADAYSDAAASDGRFRAEARDPEGYQYWQQSDRGLERALELPLDADALGGQRYEISGLAEARLLDRLGPSTWRSEVASGRPLSSILASRVDFAHADARALLKAGRRAAGWEDLLAAIQDPSRRLPAAYRSWLRRPGRKVTCWLSQLGGKLQLAYARPPLEIDARTLFAVDLTHFGYERKELSLDAAKIPMLWHGPSVEWPYQRVTFYLPEGAAVTLDGRLLGRRDGSYPIAHSLAIHGGGVNLEARAGRVIVRGRTIDIRP